MALLDRLMASMSPPAALRRAVSLTEQGNVKQAFPLLAKAARAGIAEAEYRMGRCYLEATGVPPSRVEAVRWLERAANQGYVEAQAQLATLSIQGFANAASALPENGAASAANLFATNEAMAPDFDNAIKWARKAAEGGSADAQAVLGYILTSGPEPLRDLDEAHQWYRALRRCRLPARRAGLCAFHGTQRQERGAARARSRKISRRAADAGLPTALYLLGMMTERGLGIKADLAAAVDLFRQGALKGNRPSQARWGMALMRGHGVAANPIEGESWLRRAALAGDPEAAAAVGDLYAKGGHLPPNYAEAAIWFRHAAETGHRGASRALGLLYLTGAGVARDSEEAARWFRISAEAGDPNARVDLANLLLRGEAGTDDAVQTREWFEQAAATGDLMAAFNFGVCLAEGVGVERDDRKAAEWLRRAADGVVNAQYWYGRMLTEGRGMDANPEEGRAWVKRAADVGMTEAEVLLAEMMLTGRGGSKDHPGALALFEKAAGRGHVGAMFALGAMNGGGHEVPMDRPTAQRWFSAAAERGHAYAPDDAGSLPGTRPGRRTRSGARACVAGARAGAGVAGSARRSRRPAADRRTGTGRAAAGAPALNEAAEAERPDHQLPDNAQLAREAFEQSSGGNRRRERRRCPTLVRPGLPSGATGPDPVTGARHRLPRPRRPAGGVPVRRDNRRQRRAGGVVRPGNGETPAWRCGRCRRRARRGVGASRAWPRTGSACRCHRAGGRRRGLVQPVGGRHRDHRPGWPRSSGRAQAGRTQCQSHRRPAAEGLAGCQGLGGDRPRWQASARQSGGYSRNPANRRLRDDQGGRAGGLGVASRRSRHRSGAHDPIRHRPSDRSP